MILFRLLLLYDAKSSRLLTGLSHVELLLGNVALVTTFATTLW